MEEVLFETEEVHDRTDIAVTLRDIADKIDDGRVTLGAGEQKITLDIPRRAEFEVKVERETSSSGSSELGLELELEWAEGESDDGPLRVE